MSFKNNHRLQKLLQKSMFMSRISVSAVIAKRSADIIANEFIATAIVIT